MTTVRPSAYPAAAGPPVRPVALPETGQFDQLRDFVDRAAHGEIDLEIGAAPAIAADGKLPSGWYAGPPREAAARPLLQRTRLRPEVFAGLLGLGAGLALLVPFAMWWQYTLSGAGMPASLATTLVEDARSTAAPAKEAQVDVVSVKAVTVGRPVEDETIVEARTLLADGEVLAARALLAKTVAARDPEGLFLMAETYDPNILAAHRARGVGADTERARGLYRAAQNLGHARSAARLDALR